MAKSIIGAESVTKRFGDIVAVDDISFDVKPGEIFAFLGPNGAGKSTTIKMLTTMLRPTSGKLTLAGHEPLGRPLIPAGVPWLWPRGTCRITSPGRLNARVSSRSTSQGSHVDPP